MTRLFKLGCLKNSGISNGGFPWPAFNTISTTTWWSSIFFRRRKRTVALKISSTGKKKTTLLGLVLTEDNKYALYKVTKLAGYTGMARAPKPLPLLHSRAIGARGPRSVLPVPSAKQTSSPLYPPATGLAGQDAASSSTQQSRGTCCKGYLRQEHREIKGGLC